MKKFGEKQEENCKYSTEVDGMGGNGTTKTAKTNGKNNSSLAVFVLLGGGANRRN